MKFKFDSWTNTLFNEHLTDLCAIDEVNQFSPPYVSVAT